jgi:23S rRNA (adenine2503-C2)-methyltransferase
MGSTEAINRQVVERYWDAHFRRDWARMATFFTPTAHYTDVGADGAGATGPDEIIARLRLGIEPLEAYLHFPKHLIAEGERLNIVMMGQGEPLLNLPAVVKATRILADPAGVGLSPRRITLSTSGIVPKMAELGREPVRPKLAISLNASTEEMRRELMPITRKYPLADLLAACRVYPLRPWERLTFEYVLLKGVNDSDADARRVVRLLANLNCKLNLIALNPGPEIPFETPAAPRVTAFQEIVRRSLPCFVRQPRGRDVFAACGQLRRVAG